MRPKEKVHHNQRSDNYACALFPLLVYPLQSSRATRIYNVNTVSLPPMFVPSFMCIYQDTAFGVFLRLLGIVKLK